MDLHALKGVLEHIRPTVVFTIGPIPVTSTVVNTWIIMAILLPLAYFLTKGLGTIPHGTQHLPELVAEFFNNLLEEAMGRKGRRYLPLVGSLFIFILFLNLSWFIPGMKPPTTDLSTTLAFALATIIFVQLIGIKGNGFIGYIKHFLEPSPFLFPLNVLSELIKPLSLSLRLFANMFGEETVVTVLFLMVPFFSPVPVMFLGVLMGLIQAFVFSLLTVIYIANYIKGH